MVNELYRQSIHLGTGFVFAILATMLSKEAFMWVAAVGVLLSVIVLFFADSLASIFSVLERSNSAFRGKGLLYFMLGVFFVSVLFWEQTALSILVLAVPDSIATIAGVLLKGPSLPYNKRKTLFGSLAFFFSACVVLSFKFHLVAIFFISLLLTALESFDYHDIVFLDDNIVIPVVAGYLLTFL